MDYQIKKELIALSRERRDGLSDQKGREYTKTGDEYQTGGDILANFKRNAERFKVSPITVLGVYMGKHFDSIENFISEIVQCGSYEEAVKKSMEGEGIISRIDDAANYLDLLEALLFEFRLHPFSFDLSEASYDTTDELIDEALDKGTPGPAQLTLLEEVEEAAAAELAEFTQESPFKGSRETGVE